MRKSLEIDADTSVQVGGSVLGKILAISTVEIGRLAAQGVVVRLGRARFDLWQSIRGYVVWLRQRIRDGRTAPAEHTRDLASAKIRETRERADKLSLDNARVRGELVPIDEMVAVLSTFIGAARARVLGSGLDPDEKERLLVDLCGLLTSAAENHERNGNGASKPGGPSGSTAPVQLPAVGGQAPVPLP